ncbi:similar to Kazachstania africana KAFR_0A01680 hypothetical protein [Maudiozyma saulgeensis]|uniref:Mitochondrial peculiar membrane protein 1 n=1 Tax=Maudiozyma saulgeensis TaxID=1789683 RepID=A0A1X7R817_9SACH|nr:similar to Kazachstania africana KAFR_0A01680 hypothetical protein [Kazachstania saulgeensis]
MGLFSSIDNSQQVNEDYVKKKLNQRDLFSETWFSSHNGETLPGNPLESLSGWPFSSLYGRGINVEPVNITSPFDSRSEDDYVHGDQIKEEGVTGLYNYKTPSDTQFAQCMDSQGLSVWDTNGWWRCLFPQNIIRQNLPNLQETESAMILTKQKVENDVNHKFGLYFTDYTKYLVWKSQMNKIIKDKREKEIENLKKPQLTKSADHKQDNELVTMTPESLMLSDDSALSTPEKDKLIIGTSEVLRSSMSSEGLTEETKELKTYYDDGSIILKTEKKVTPHDGGSPRVETHERVLRQGRDKSSSGFPFWSRKK